MSEGRISKWLRTPRRAQGSFALSSYHVSAQTAWRIIGSARPADCLTCPFNWRCVCCLRTHTRDSDQTLYGQSSVKDGITCIE